MVARYIPGFMALGVVLAAYKLLGGSELFDQFTKKELQDSYDYIIVGGGSSGAVLASRITEDEGNNVLLLEAGGDPEGNSDIDIPIRADKVRGSEFDWQYKTVPQKHSCLGHVDRVSNWPSGKGLGGTSLLNYMLYMRGSRHDYDEWAGNGAHGWGFKDVLPYFIKSEDNQNGKFTRTIFHGYGGKMTVADVSTTATTKIMKGAFKELGVKTRDTNGRVMFGYGTAQATVRYGTRFSTYRSFLKHTLLRDNLHVITNAFVQKIMFDGKKANGVIFKHNGKQNFVKATKEIILSAGTVGSTKLLLLSGVGPQAHLKALKIPVVADLPVGDNLQDWVMGDPIEFYTDYSVSATPAKAENFLSSWAYTLFGSGMKMSPRFREGMAFLRTRHQPQHIRYPLIALQVLSNIQVYNPETVNVKEDVWNAIHGKPPTKEGFSIFPILLHPRSRGTIRLRSSNPEDQPLINPNYLSDETDVKLLTDAVQYIREAIAGTTVMNQWDIKLNQNILPQCAKHGNYTEEYIECYLRQITLSGYSPVGTCKMGAPTDPTSVVDPQLRIRGLKNIRVVDSSIIPQAMSGNTYTTQVMIAEKVSDWIRDKDTVKPIKEYFKHLISVKHKKIVDDDDHPSTDIRAGKDKDSEKEKKH